ncbi:MAG TPA: ATP-binding protein [Frankiaceae bacterium]|nr:ATP-binding protein [Frankiaceae bacterium]
MIRPLDRIGAIKLKLGIVIAGAVTVTWFVHQFGGTHDLPGLLQFALALTVGLAFVLLLSRGMTSPLREMAAAARAMARGDYSQRVRATSRDEVGELARAFNTMAAELAEVDRMRRDLVANVSHELRTPISALQAVLENLVDGVTAPDRETLTAMLRQTERLSRLVSQLLDLSRLEAGTVPLHRSAFAVAPFLRETADAVLAARRATGGDGEVRVAVDPPDLRLTADPERVHQVVTNLVDNALRHSPPGAPVEVRAAARNGHVVVEVRDRGPGIPPAEAARVFERFYRSDSARSADAGGSGLGLAIARWIVDLHGGAIRAEPNHPTGCRMVVELPGRA